MKTLQTYLIEAIKPPRLSAKNKEMWKHPTEAEIMAWLKKNCEIHGRIEIVGGKINVVGRGHVTITNKDIEYFPYPFGIVDTFNCMDCKKLKSLKNSPKEVRYGFSCYGCSSLKSLEGAPQKSGYAFNCEDCGKKFTKEDVLKVCEIDTEFIFC